MNLTTYNSLIRPTLEFACTVWDLYRKNQTDKLGNIQRQAVRFILSQYSRLDLFTSMLEQLNFLLCTLNEKIARLKFLIMLSRNLLNVDTSRFQKPCVTRAVRGVQNRSLQISQINNDTYKFSFLVRTADATATYTLYQFQWYSAKAVGPTPVAPTDSFGRAGEMYSKARCSHESSKVHGATTSRLQHSQNCQQKQHTSTAEAR